MPANLISNQDPTRQSKARHHVFGDVAAGSIRGSPKSLLILTVLATAAERFFDFR